MKALIAILKTLASVGAVLFLAHLIENAFHPKYKPQECFIQTKVEEWETATAPCKITAVGKHKYLYLCPSENLQDILLYGEEFAYYTQSIKLIDDTSEKIACPENY